MFNAAFYASLVILASAVAHICTRAKFVRIPARISAVIAQWTLVIAVIAGIVTRFMHTGRVCAGDFLGAEESTEGYLVTQGNMLAFIMYMWVTLFGLGLCVALISIFLMTS